MKNSKPYLTENLYKALEQKQRRGTLTIVKTKMTNVELEPQKEGIKEQWWNADIEVENTDQEGQTNISTLAYIIKAKLVDGQWKIDDLVYVQGRGTHEDIEKEIHVARAIDYRGSNGERTASSSLAACGRSLDRSVPE